MANFSQPSNTLPLRKSDIDKTPVPPPPVVPTPPKPVNVPVKKPSFLPRVIATPSSKKKKIQVVKSVGSKDKVQETGENQERDGQMPCADTTPDTSEKRDESSLGPTTSEPFIGPLLPHDTPSSHPAALPTPPVATTSPKIARVQPQVKPAKPVALVHPVVSSTPGGRKFEKLIRKGGLAFNRTPQPQNDKPQWKPVGAPDPVSSTSTPTTPNIEPVEKTSETPSRAGEVESAQETKKRKRHKKKKSHKREERDDSERGRERHKQGDEKGKRRRAHSLESSEEEWKVRKKVKTHESRKEKKKSRRERSNSSSSDESSDSRHHHRREHHRDKKHEVGKAREGWHRDRGHREERRHESKRQRHQSTSSSHSHHKSRHHTPSSDRSKKKRRWSSNSDEDSRKRHKSDRHHSQKKYHSSEHHYKHHDKIQKSKHLSSIGEPGGKTHSHHRHKHRNDEGRCDSDVDPTLGQEEHIHMSARSAHRVLSTDERESVRTEQKKSVAVEKTGQRSGGDVPEVEWDSSLKAEGKGGKGSSERGKWDGSHNHAVVEALMSHEPNQLGTKGMPHLSYEYLCSHDVVCHVVKSWDGGDNSIDTTTVPDEWKRKKTDTWNQELDKGKVNGRLPMSSCMCDSDDFSTVSAHMCR